MKIFDITKIAHESVSKVVKEGDTVIDATCGNGRDTVFLGELVGKNGRVYAFDIQKKAVENTLTSLKERGLDNRVEIINSSHEYIANYVQEKVKTVMFNLGYLPKGDKSIITCPNSTIKAISASMDLLDTKGLISICVYTSHPGGLEEAKAIEDYLKTTETEDFKILKFSNLKNEKSPYLLLIYKIR